ncbi:MAG: sigma 54-interacting transcriptional regulator [Peptococcaceae bacterium]|nr:sigma 54-interacting transcriptional regulator [Peptococcaceae bacterium]
MKVGNFASSNPVALREKENLAAAAATFLKHGIDGAPVIDERGHIVGILTKTHLYRAIVQGIPFDQEIGLSMKRDVKTIRADRPVEEAWQMAWEFNIGRLPVVDQAGRLVAMMTRTDLVKAFEILYQNLDAIINSSYDGIVVVDGHGDPVRYNEAFKKLVLHLDNRNSGKDAPGGEFMGDSGLNRAIKEISRQAMTRKEPVSVVRRLGGGREILLTANPIVSEQNSRVSRVMVNCRDITDLTKLKKQLEKSRELTEVYQSELEKLHSRLLGHTFVCNSPQMRKVIDLAVRVARVDSTVLLLGDSGVGKEVVARLIHKAGCRSKLPFIRINCGAIPENLLESELFGYEGGAFTGARREGKPGLIELAHRGTLFLDEIAELPPALQVKLLTVIQEKVVTRLGGTRPFQVDLRIIAATNRNLQAMVEQGRFRADLYYRLNVIPIVIPPLRERKDDIPFLISHFLQKFNEKHHQTKSIDAAAMDILCTYSWPGNVRELENLIERLVVVTPGDTIGPRDLPLNILNKGAHGRFSLQEKEFIAELYHRLQSTRKVAEVLGVNQSTVVRKMKKYGIARED